MFRFIFPALTASALLLAGCTTEPPSRYDREALQQDVDAAMQQMCAADPTLQPFLNKANGYAVFPAVGKGGLVIGGAYGHGQVYQYSQFVGYADMSQATIGPQIGGQSYSEIVAFQTADALARFESGQFTFAATGSAVIIKAGAAASARYDDGVSLFVQPVGGLMLEGALGAQSFSFQPK
jgi:lipid-binding SYLF domain-containing protein